MCTYYYRGQWVGYDDAPPEMPENETEEEEVFVDNTYSVYEEYLEEMRQKAIQPAGSHVELVKQ